ncbi:hypothetical protein MNBD_CHLOROFLEXI01-1526 [hydrothermal vent metagenome]|uniref:HNH nuclease domain-containing protein n=1 Tax=hydrothermal vent metagenome TaxID=652676 RepID=A0A3B0USV8_9ZZZZ
MSKRYISTENQEQIKTRAAHRCEYCQSWASYSAQPFVYEHIIPIAKGGETHLDNLCYACGGCNGHKYTKIKGVDPVSKSVASLYHPRTQNWHQHFGWSDDYLQLVGLTFSTASALFTKKIGSLMNCGVGAWPCARPVKGDHKGRPYKTPQ